MPQGSQSQIRPVQDYAFLQYLMKNGYMKMQQALDILEQLYGQGEPTKLAALMSGFNTSLRNHNMSIEKMLSLVGCLVEVMEAIDFQMIRDSFVKCNGL